METQEMLSVLKEDILHGLSAHPKHIPSKYFYDDEGSRIFSRIMRMPEYYLTDCEYEIFEEQRDDILKQIATGKEAFDIVELGAGDGMKTSLLIEYFTGQNVNFKYVPVDISTNALRGCVESMQNRFPELLIEDYAGDYFEVLQKFGRCDSCKRVALFLGSNIGNYTPNEARDFYRKLSDALTSGDMVLSGFDLVKDPKIIQKAYDDPHGLTRAFNLNLLRRMNRELQAEFDTQKFIHQPIYDPMTGIARSYLVSTEKQIVYVGALERSFHFDAWEPLNTEMSRKFTPEIIQQMAENTGYEVIKNFFDRRGYYLNSLWKKL